MVTSDGAPKMDKVWVGGGLRPPEVVMTDWAPKPVWVRGP